MTEPLLKMLNISKTYPGVKALDNVSFLAYPGEALALVGENGAGKSTLMNILAGVDNPDEGEIIIADKKVEIRKPADSLNHGVAFVHQEFALLPYMTVMENIYISSFKTRCGVLERQAMKQKCDEVLKKIGCSFPRI
jgi:ABC-type sugar transport system ATPase subunit